MLSNQPESVRMTTLTGAGSITWTMDQDGQMVFQDGAVEEQLPFEIAQLRESVRHVGIETAVEIARFRNMLDSAGTIIINPHAVSQFITALFAQEAMPIDNADEDGAPRLPGAGFTPHPNY